VYYTIKSMSLLKIEKLIANFQSVLSLNKTRAKCTEYNTVTPYELYTYHSSADIIVKMIKDSAD
jgi:hypothetical protein